MCLNKLRALLQILTTLIGLDECQDFKCDVIYHPALVSLEKLKESMTGNG